MLRRNVCLVGLVALVAGSGWTDDDFGLWRDHALRAFSGRLFGVVGPVAASSTRSIDAADGATPIPTALVTVAHRACARASSRRAPNAGRQHRHDGALAERPDTRLTSSPATRRGRPTRVSSASGSSDGMVETILTGTSSCDPVRRTPWGTIIVGEEVGTRAGWLLEIINPLAHDGRPLQPGRPVRSRRHRRRQRRDARRRRPTVVRRDRALPERRHVLRRREPAPARARRAAPTSSSFPTSPWPGGAPITNLPSPRSRRRQRLRPAPRQARGNTDYGQGTNTGLGTWIEVVDASDNANLRAAAADAQADRLLPARGPRHRPSRPSPTGNVRFCGNNTGNESDDHNWGETICVTDGTLERRRRPTPRLPEVQYFVIGTPELAMMDNIAYQPGARELDHPRGRRRPRGRPQQRPLVLPGRR